VTRQEKEVVKLKYEGLEVKGRLGRIMDIGLDSLWSSATH